MGVEPTNGGFADLSLRPLGYRAENIKYSEIRNNLSGASELPGNANLPIGAALLAMGVWRNPMRKPRPSTRANTRATKFKKLTTLFGRGCFSARRHGLHLRFANEARGFFGRRGANIETRAPLEARDLGEFRDDFDMPVVMLAGFLSDG